MVSRRWDAGGRSYATALCQYFTRPVLSMMKSPPFESISSSKEDSKSGWTIVIKKMEKSNRGTQKGKRKRVKERREKERERERRTYH